MQYIYHSEYIWLVVIIRLVVENPLEELPEYVVVIPYKNNNCKSNSHKNIIVALLSSYQG